MTDIKVTGGARVGMANATWPFATLKVTKDKLELNASIVGNLVFRASDIVSLVPQQGAFFERGLRIIHRVPTYNENVIFWALNPNELLKKIEQTGFLTNDSPLPTNTETEILNNQTKGGFPIKLPATITFAVVWNILLLFDIMNFIKGNKQSNPLGIGALTALGFAFLTGLLILTVEPLRKSILKDGRTVDDIKTFVYFMMLICGVMMLGITIIN